MAAATAEPQANGSSAPASTPASAPNSSAPAASDRSHPSSVKSFELPSKSSPRLHPTNGQPIPGEREKTSVKVKDRITRMFSQRSSNNDSSANLAGIVHKDTKKDAKKDKKATPAASQPTSAVTSIPSSVPASPTHSPTILSSQPSTLHLPAKADHPGPASSNGSGPPSAPGSGAVTPTSRSQAPSRKGSTTEKLLHEKLAGAAKDKNGKAAKEALLSRFVADLPVEGGHEHHLKSSRRQEKLVDLWHTFIGKKHPELPQSDLSLVANWVDNLKQEKDTIIFEKKESEKRAAAEKKDKKSDRNGPPSTLVEKYGKCSEVIGRGAFGIVRISHKKYADGSERKFAVKEFRRKGEEPEKKYSKRLTSEFCISSSLRHPNVIHTLDLLKDARGDYCEVMEYCAGGDLYSLILTATKLEVQEADCFFKQLMRGVEYMHEMGVAHRDLKPENLLLTTHGGLKITDFGNGECFRMAWETDAHMVTGLCGSAPYIAPEEYTNKEFDARAVDVWACGVIYMAMRSGRHLWRVAKKDEDEFYARYLEGRRDEEGYQPIETLHRARCRNVIYSILDPSPARRISASQVLKSEWVREIKLCKAGEEGI